MTLPKQAKPAPTCAEYNNADLTNSSCGTAPDHRAVAELAAVVQHDLLP